MGDEAGLMGTEERFRSVVPVSTVRAPRLALAVIAMIRGWRWI